MEEELIKFLSDRLRSLTERQEEYESEDIAKKYNFKDGKFREETNITREYYEDLKQIKSELELAEEEFEEVSTALQEREIVNSEIERYNKTKEKLLYEQEQYNQELEKLGKRYSFEGGTLKDTIEIRELKKDLSTIQNEIASLDQKIEESQENVKYCNNVLNEYAKKYSEQIQKRMQEQETMEQVAPETTNPVQPQQTEEQPEAVVEQTNSEKTMSRFGDEEELKKLSKQELVSKMVSVIQDEISQKDFPKNIMDIRKNVTRIPGLNFEASKVPFIYELIEDLGIDHLDFIGFGEDDRYPKASSSLRGIERVLNCLEPHLKTESDRLSDDSEYIDRFKELMVKTLDFITLLNEKGILEDKIKVDNLMKGSWIDYESTLDEATNSITGINRTQTKSEPEAYSPQSEKDPEKKKQPTVAENKTRQGDIPTEAEQTNPVQQQQEMATQAETEAEVTNPDQPQKGYEDNAFNKYLDAFYQEKDAKVKYDKTLSQEDKAEWDKAIKEKDAAYRELTTNLREGKEKLPDSLRLIEDLIEVTDDTLDNIVNGKTLEEIKKGCIDFDFDVGSIKEFVESLISMDLPADDKKVLGEVVNFFEEFKNKLGEQLAELDLGGIDSNQLYNNLKTFIAEYKEKIIDKKEKDVNKSKATPAAEPPKSENDSKKKTHQGDIPIFSFAAPAINDSSDAAEDISTDGQENGAPVQGDIYFGGRNREIGDLTEEELKKTGDTVRKVMAEKKAKKDVVNKEQEGNSTKSNKTTGETEPKTTRKEKKTIQTTTKTTSKRTEPKVSEDREGPKPKLIIDASTGMVTFIREGEVPVEVKLEKTLLGRIGRSGILRDAKKFLGKDAPSVYMGLFGNKYNTAVISVLMKAGEKGLLENYLSKEYEGYNSLKNMGFDYSTNLENYTISDSQFRILNRALVHDGEDLNAEKRLGGRRNLLAKQIAYKLGLSSEGLPVAKQDKHDVKKNEEAKEDAKSELADAAQEDYLAKLATESKKLKEQIEKCPDEYKKKILLEKIELVKRKRAYIKLLQMGEPTEQEKIQKSVDIVEKKVAIAHLEKDDPKLSDEKRNQKIYNYNSLYIKFAEQKLRDDRISDTERVALEEGLRRSRMELDRMNPNNKDNYEKSFRDRMRYDVERRNKLYENSKSDRSKSAKKNLRKVIGKYKEAKEGRMYGSRTTLGKAIARMRYEIAARKAIKNKGTEKGE